MKKEYYFAYFIASKGISGVVRTWEECQSKVLGESSARYKKFTSHREAIEYIKQQLDSLEHPRLDFIPKPPAEIKTSELDKNALYFDSGTGRGLGIEVSVTDFQGNSQLTQLLEDQYFTHSLSEWGSYIFDKQEGYTNNFGELFGLFCALCIALKQGYTQIYGDSKLVIEYWSLGRMKVNALNPKTVELIHKVVKQRKLFEGQGGKILFMNGSKNPADMGFHK